MQGRRLAADDQKAHSMTVAEAKKALENDTAGIYADGYDPLCDPSTRWKICDYLWACHREDIPKGECMDWLRDAFRYTGMTHQEEHRLIISVELALEVLGRVP